MRVCTKCKQEKFDDQFAKHSTAKHGKQSVCKACDSLRGKLYLLRPGAKQRRAETSAAWYRRNKPTVQLAKVRAYREQRARYLIWQAAKRAKKKGIAFDLDLHVAAIQARIDAGRCELSGLPFVLDQGRTYASPSLDRIDSRGGYTYDNIRIVCHAINVALGDWGEEALQEVIDAWNASSLRKRKPSLNA